MSKNRRICLNCGEKGHHNKYCTKPIVSYGIVLYKINKFKKLSYLLVQRKDSLSYVERGSGVSFNTRCRYFNSFSNSCFVL